MSLFIFTASKYTYFIISIYSRALFCMCHQKKIKFLCKILYKNWYDKKKKSKLNSCEYNIFIHIF